MVLLPRLSKSRLVLLICLTAIALGNGCRDAASPSSDASSAKPLSDSRGEPQSDQEVARSVPHSTGDSTSDPVAEGTADAVPIAGTARGSNDAWKIGVDDQRFHAHLTEEISHVDPKLGGWSTEVLAEQLGGNLKQLSAFLEGGSAEEVSGLLVPDFRSTSLRPEALEEVWSDGPLRVLQSTDHEPPTPDLCDSNRLQVLRDAIWQSLPGAEERDVFLKIIHVTLANDTAQTEVVFKANGHDAKTRLQQTAALQCTWQIDRLGGQHRLAEIRTTSFEEAWYQAETPLYRDRTSDVMSNAISFSQQLAHGLDYWRQRLDWRHGIEVTGPYGLAIGDADGDGWDDVYICETGGLPNRLYRHLPNGTLEDISSASRTDYLEPTQSALFVDLDNDGDQDLVLTCSSYVLFLENDGKAQFTRRFMHSSDSVGRSLSAADYDQDGRLDIYVCGYFSRGDNADSVGLGRPMPYHDANNGVPNMLLKSVGDWQFKDVTAEVGLDQNNRRFSYAASWEDFDLDGDLDLYVANDFGRNNLFQNQAGRFVDIAAQAAVEDISAGMSVSWGDYNRDGRPDIYVGNMFSSAGNRIVYQRKFRPSEATDTRAAYQRHARGNTLFEATEDGTFRDRSLDAGVEMGLWSWGSIFVDVNNDGWDDLVVANGMVTSEADPGDL